MNNIKKEDEMYCPKCGKVLKKDMKVCPFCNIDLSKNGSKKQKSK